MSRPEPRNLESASHRTSRCLFPTLTRVPTFLPLWVCTLCSLYWNAPGLIFALQACPLLQPHPGDVPRALPDCSADISLPHCYTQPCLTGAPQCLSLSMADTCGCVSTSGADGHLLGDRDQTSVRSSYTGCTQRCSIHVYRELPPDGMAIAKYPGEGRDTGCSRRGTGGDPGDSF